MIRTETEKMARTFLRGLWRFGRNTRGSALPEYALVLAILVAGTCLAYVATASNVDRVLRLTTQLTGRSSDTQPSILAARDGLNGSPVATERAAANELGNTSWSAQNATMLLGIVAWVTTMAGGLLLMRIIRGRSKGAHDRSAVADTNVPMLDPTAYDRLVEKRQQICRLVTRDAENAGGVQTRVGHLMSRHLATVLPETLLTEAVATMADQGIRHLLVCRKGGSLVGIISDRDVKNRVGTTVADIMTAKPVVVPLDMAVGPAITLMLSRSISCLPVVDGNKLVGVLTTTDIMLSCQCMLQVMEKIASGLCLTDPCVGNRISEMAREEDSQEWAAVTA